MRKGRIILFETACDGPRGINPEHVVDVCTGGTAAPGTYIKTVLGGVVLIPDMSVKEVVDMLNGPDGHPYRGGGDG